MARKHVCNTTGHHALLSRRRGELVEKRHSFPLPPYSRITPVLKSQHLLGEIKKEKNNTSPTRRFVLIIIISPRPTIASELERDANFRPYVARSTIITAYKVGPDQC